MKQRVLSFGNSTVGLLYGEGRPAELVHFLFGHIPDDDVGEPWTRFRLEDHGGDAGFWLMRDEELISQNLSAGRMADFLMGQVCFTLAHESRGGLLLHAAAVQGMGRGIILPGKSGAGKSTLTAWLVSNGFNYLSDEMVFVPAGSNVFSGFMRPITIKSPARHLLPKLVKDGQTGGGIVVQKPVEMLPPERFGARIVEGEASLDFIVFPRYRDGKEAELRLLSKAQAAFELMRCLANARNLADHGFPEAVRLAKSTPAYALSYGDTGESWESIETLLSSKGYSYTS